LRQWGENFSGALVHDLQALLSARKEIELHPPV
jgi:hypothetical protein